MRATILCATSSVLLWRAAELGGFGLAVASVIVMWASVLVVVARSASAWRCIAALALVSAVRTLGVLDLGTVAMAVVAGYPYWSGLSSPRIPRMRQALALSGAVVSVVGADHFRFTAVEILACMIVLLMFSSDRRMTVIVAVAACATGGVIATTSFIGWFMIASGVLFVPVRLSRRRVARRTASLHV